MNVHKLGAREPSGYRVVARGDRAEMYLYGPIGASFWGDGISADQFRKDLKALGAVKAIDVRINSEGGDVFDGRAIYNLLLEHPATVTVHIDGLAASAASFIAMAGNSIEIAEGAFVMVHNASGVCIGNAGEMRRLADLLETVDGTLVDTYVARTKNTPEKVRKWMKDETWFKGREAVENGFADLLVENLKVAASVRDPSRFKHLPTALYPKRAAAAAELAAYRATL